jgi:hypothetical protein
MPKLCALHVLSWPRSGVIMQPQIQTFATFCPLVVQSFATRHWLENVCVELLTLTLALRWHGTDMQSGVCPAQKMAPMNCRQSTFTVKLRTALVNLCSTAAARLQQTCKRVLHSCF